MLIYTVARYRTTNYICRRQQQIEIGIIYSFTLLVYVVLQIKTIYIYWMMINKLEYERSL